MCRYESAGSCEESSSESITAASPVEPAKKGVMQLQCDQRLLSMVDEASQLMMPLQFADLAERVATLAQ